ncbi:Probable polygalacturonase [Linum perenne]
MSGGIQDVRAEDITAINTKSGVRIKTGVGRGGYVKDIYVKDIYVKDIYVKDIYVRRMTMHTMKWAFWMTGNYGSHADKGFDLNALPIIQNINYRYPEHQLGTWWRTMCRWRRGLEGIAGDPFTQICISNVTIGLAAKANKVPWTCTDVGGITSGVSPRPCDFLPEQGPEKMAAGCDYPTETLPIDSVELKTCSSKISYFM